MKTKVNYNYSNWNKINWKNVDKLVFALQKKIFNASRSDIMNKVHKLQNTLINSLNTKLLAIRQVTQDNKGKKTAGVDGVKSISPQERWILAHEICIDGNASPIRRVIIPKKDGSNRSLGIPTITDRVKQKLVLLALEPQWEAKFDPNSYGFRPGRSSHDAIEAIFKAINRLPKYVLDADIEKCFDKISHKALIKKLNTFPKFKNQIKSWLKSGILDSDPFNSSESLIKETLEGTPQGGVISPLLANIALNGLENTLKQKVLEKYNVKTTRSLTIVRYADDIAIVHPDKKIIIFCKEELNHFLFKMGLRLNEDKTQIVHTLNRNSFNIRGFTYLGFHVRQLPVGKFKMSKMGRAYKTLIMPSKEAVSKHVLNLKLTMRKAVKREAFISQLNPKIIGWSNYFRSSVAAKLFNYLDHKVIKMLLNRLRKIHSKRGIKWVYKRYFRKINRYKWTFYYESGQNKKVLTLARHAKVSIKRHVKVKKDYSIYDGKLEYWSNRLKKIPDISNTKLKLLKKQKSLCTLCSQTFKYGDIMEIDHITPLFKNGKRTSSNIQLVHKHCHLNKTRRDRLIE